jgi:hypothetical protein
MTVMFTCTAVFTRTAMFTVTAVFTHTAMFTRTYYSIVLLLSIYNILSFPSYSCLSLPFRIPITFILPTIFPSTTCFRIQFLRKTWTNQSTFLLSTVCRIVPRQKLNPMWVFTNIKRVDELEAWSLKQNKRLSVSPSACSCIVLFPHKPNEEIISKLQLEVKEATVLQFVLQCRTWLPAGTFVY